METPRRPEPDATETSSRTEEAKDLEFVLERELPPLIPALEYPAVFVKAERPRPFGRPEVVLWFKILPAATATDELTAGVELPYHCPAQPNGRFAPSSNYARAWQIAAGRRPTRKDRLSVAVFRHRLLRVKVRTVIVDNRRRPLAESTYYSVIDRLVGVDAARDLEP